MVAIDSTTYGYIVEHHRKASEEVSEVRWSKGVMIETPSSASVNHLRAASQALHALMALQATLIDLERFD